MTGYVLAVIQKRRNLDFCRAPSEAGTTTPMWRPIKGVEPAADFATHLALVRINYWY